MYKLSIILLLFSFILSAKGLQSNNMAKLYADSFEGSGNIVVAKGHIILSYDNTLFIGDRATYDRKNRVITLEGNVEVFGSTGNKIIANRVRFEVTNNRVLLKNFYEIDKQDIWIYAKEGKKIDDSYILKNSVISSCSPKNPDWSLKFDEAIYDSKTKYMKLRGVKLYAKDTPILYTPYLGFSLQRERHSGFLMPHFAIRNKEGFIYSQPYYLAITPSLDLEIAPQVRTDRGDGIYSTLNFADSAYSRGSIKVGYFRDRGSFQKRYELKNRDHYGFELLYSSSNIFKSNLPSDYQEEFYANLNLFNDIDYHNLQFNRLKHLEATSRYQESRVNYFFYNNKNYFGVTGKYFIDTQANNNKRTIQELPSLEYHRSYSQIFLDNLDYSIDTEFKNYYREDGIKAQKFLTSIPFLFHKSLLDDYINLSIEEKLVGADTHFNDKTLWSSSSELKDNHYASLRLWHTIELSSDIMRSYESGSHTILFKTAFTKASTLAEGNLKYDDIAEGLKSEFDLNQFFNSKVTFSMHNFWKSYDGSIDIDYLLMADYYPSDDSKWNEIYQEFQLKYGNFRLYNQLKYSIEYSSLKEIANTLYYSNRDIELYLTHTKRVDRANRHLDSNEFEFDFISHINKKWNIFGEYSYDFRNKTAKDWDIGVSLDRECWNSSISFKQKITPILKANGGSSIKDNSIQLKFNLIPFGGAKSVSNNKLSQKWDRN